MIKENENCQKCLDIFPDIEKACFDHKPNTFDAGVSLGTRIQERSDLYDFLLTEHGRGNDPHDCMVDPKDRPDFDMDKVYRDLEFTQECIKICREAK